MKAEPVDPCGRFFCVLLDDGLGRLRLECFKSCILQLVGGDR